MTRVKFAGSEMGRPPAGPRRIAAMVSYRDVANNLLEDARNEKGPAIFAGPFWFLLLPN